MASKTSPSPPSAVHPPLGTLIDGGSLELVEVLGVGGYGVVYRAVDVRYPSKSYAVKCLVAAGHQTARQRQIHIREITLHQLASIHPGVVTLHRVVEHFNHTYIIMDYAPDHDLFTQILHNCRYLGNDALIKDVFLQMLDAVEYCHSLGIYHRDLKPENILCFDDGLRVAITDFGLATTDKISDEFRTGSVYHMSPECQGGAFAPGGKYSPMFNDIWSLGIILLNLATGRNPWKSATADDPTFQAYLHNPYGFLPTVLPISSELNDILVQMLEVDWRQRMKLHDIRYAIEELTSFYSDGVVFEGSMARCPWEAGMDIDSESSEENVEEATPSPPVSVSPSSPVKEASRLTSSWSKESTSDIIFAGRSPIKSENYGAPWPEYSSCGATWAFDSPASSSSSNDVPFDRCETPSEASTESPTPSLPATPNQFDMTFGTQQPKVAGLTINTKLNSPRIFVNGHNESMDHTFSTDSDMMHTAIEYDPYSSLFFLSTPISAKLAPDSAVTAVAEDKEMVSPSVWRRSYIQMASPDDDYSPREDQSTHNFFARSASPSPEEPRWSSLMASPQHPFAQVQSQLHHPSQPTFPPAFSPMTDSSPRQQGQRQPRVFSPRKPLRKSLVPASPIPPSPTAAHAGHSPLTVRTPVATSTRVAPKQQPQPRAQANAQEQQQGRFFSRPTPSPQQAAAPAAASAQVGTSARGRVVNTKPYSTFGRRKAAAQQAGQGHQGVQDQDVVESRSSAGGRSSKTSSRCSSRSGRESVGSSGGNSAVFEKVERRRVVGRRNATRHWFNPGKFFAAVGAA